MKTNWWQSGEWWKKNGAITWITHMSLGLRYWQQKTTELHELYRRKVQTGKTKKILLMENNWKDNTRKWNVKRFPSWFKFNGKKVVNLFIKFQKDFFVTFYKKDYNIVWSIPWQLRRNGQIAKWIRLIARNKMNHNNNICQAA